MSKVLRLSSALPGDERINGLDSLAPELTLDSVVVAVVTFDVPSINVSKDGAVPVLRVRKVEPLGTPSEVPAEVVAATLAAEERRTNSTPLPFGVLNVPDEGGRPSPDECDHVDFTIERDHLEDVPEGMFRETCLRCGWIQYQPIEDVDERIASMDDDEPESTVE
jgi:hypothetical protein